MTILDIILIILLLASIGYSVYRGMTKEIFSLVAIFVGYIAANNLYYKPAQILNHLLNNMRISGSIAFFIIFALAVLVVTLLGKLVTKIMQMNKGTSFLDRAVGGIFGLVKGVLIISMALLIISLIPYLRNKLVERSKISKYILESSNMISKFSYNKFSDNSMVNGVKDKLGEGAERLKGLTDIVGTIMQPDPDTHIEDEDRKRLDKIINDKSK